MVATSTTQFGARPLYAAFDVEEFLHADVGAEAGFGEHVSVGAHQLERDLVGDDGRISVSDIGERSGMHERGSAFERLHQVGQDGVLHQNGESAAYAQIVGGDGIAGAIGADNHAAQTVAHIGEIGGERQHGHDLAGHRDIEAGDAGPSLFLGTLPDGDLPQHAVARIDDSAPRDASRIDIETRKFASLFGGELIRIRLRDSEIAQAAQHYGRESAAVIFRRRTKPVEQCLIGLAQFVEDSRVDGGGQ